ncbi:hypothetical protein AAVH_43447, partial [Aphelenchoides avenae]
VPLEEQSLLNQTLNEKLDSLHEGDLTISKLRRIPHRRSTPSRALKASDFT